MKKSTKHYVEYVIQNSVRSSDIPHNGGVEEHEIPSRDEEHLVFPFGAIAYRYFDRDVIEEGGRKYTSDDRLNETGTTYIEGMIFTLDGLKKHTMIQPRVLLDAIDSGADYFLRDKRSNTYALQPEDRLVQSGRVVYPDEKRFPPLQKGKGR